MYTEMLVAKFLDKLSSPIYNTYTSEVSRYNAFKENYLDMNCYAIRYIPWDEDSKGTVY